jgi:outer membrane protein assembly factor BamB
MEVIKMRNSLILLFFSLSMFGCDHDDKLNCPDGEISASEAVWSHGEGDLQNSKRATALRDKRCYLGPHENPSLQWSFEIGGSGTGAAPVIGPDGTIYLVAEYPGGSPGTGGIRNSGLFAISPQGQEKWFFSRPIDLGFAESLFYASSVAIGTDGTVYFTWYDSTLYALSSEGTIKWKRTVCNVRTDTLFIIGSRLASPVIDRRGRIYTANDTIFCFSKDGEIIWTYTDTSITEMPLQAISIGRYGLYCMSNDGILCVDFEGQKKWFRTTGFIGFRHRTIILDESDNLYFHSGIFGQNIHSLDRNGNLRWEVGFNTPAGLTRAVLRGDYLYFASWDILARLDIETGTKADSLSQVPIVGWGNTILIDDSGVIYVGGVRSGQDAKNAVSAVSDTGRVLWFKELPEINGFGAPPALARDGSIFFVSFFSSAINADSRKLYSIR